MNGPKPLVVVVDDEQGILEIVSRVAQRVGYEAMTYSNGREAIADLRTKRADLVLVDHDVLTIPAEELKSTKVVWTMFGGRIIYGPSPQ